METAFSQNPDAFLRLHADCLPVKGACRSAIYDLTRNGLIFFPSDYYPVLDYLGSGPIGAQLEKLEDPQEKQLVLDFIAFLEGQELVCYLENPALFPPMPEQWDCPAQIQHALVDVNQVSHDFPRIFEDLDALGCQYVQVRSFSNLLQLPDLYQLVEAARHKSIQGLELLLPYDPGISDADWVRLVEDQALISSLTIHSAPGARTLVVDYGCDEETGRYIRKEIKVLTQQISSHHHCGLISVKHLNAPTVENFFETKSFNGCLNRKVAVDAAGEIRNCPSMATSYGNIRDTSLPQAIARAGFRDLWGISKDQIAVCRDCELRHACSDCRAYLENPADIYSKPLKCGYNPYTAAWEEWSRHPQKQAAIAFYQVPVS
ncbi:MAG: grasp-with-spasm system SPASM domain peptide maturase [Adhaeribacter sp.]